MYLEKLFLQLSQISRKTSLTTLNDKIGFIIFMCLTVGLYYILDNGIRTVSALPISTYSKPIISFELIKRLFTEKTLFISIPLMLLLLVFRKSLNLSWHKLEGAMAVRGVVIFMASLLTLCYVTIDVNLYFDYTYTYDRILLVVLVFCIYWRPIFVFPFLLIFIAFTNQFNFIPIYCRYDINIPISFLMLFSVFQVLYFVTKSFNLKHYFFICGCLFAIHYFPSGIGKLDLNWIQHNKIYYLLSASYTTGWLNFIDSDILSWICKKMAPLNGVIKIMVLLIELSSVLIFINRRFTRVLLISIIILHLGILFVSGIFFWMWILIALLCYIYLGKKTIQILVRSFYTSFYFFVSIILISTGIYWCKPIKLFWQDSPFNYAYTFEAELENGDKMILPADFFAPYDLQFSMSSFHYIQKEPTLPVFFGASDSTTVLPLEHISGRENALMYEKNNGVNLFKQQSASTFEDFVKRYCLNWNKRLSKSTLFHFIEPPKIILTQPKFYMKNKQKIRNITITQVTTFFDDFTYKVIRKRDVKQINIY